ncbi:tRNA lysidine(34) synthetase TilS [Kangiella sp. TOML190]|uniref:tRNA lysidine(34) synthetase TilS n=1 Tax=Kangiella sp. TOML190 TaxID=2931351 RepID=UPI00203E1364|nr:tRNA lysidine(34) synthetase TilS [Kangiella sp. TOML190]
MSLAPSKSQPVIHALNEFLAFLSSQYPQINTLVLALSGGKDSVCLLHALSQRLSAENSANYRLKAVYIDHGLQQDSAQWGEFNKNLCQQFEVEFEQLKVSVNRQEASLEQAARKARYQALAAYIGQASCLLTGQHLDDQAETLLLQLFRGAGSKGFAAMPYVKSFAQGLQARPLLSVMRKDIEAYIQQQGLSYIDDPSNSDNTIRRNFIRNKAMPLLRTLWPELSVSLATAASNQAEAQNLLEQIAAQDLLTCQQQEALALSPLLSLSVERQNNLLRYWFDQYRIKMPSRAVFEQVRQQFLILKNDTDPKLDFGQWQLRRHQQALYLVDKASLVFDSKFTDEWQLENDYLPLAAYPLKAQSILEKWPELAGKTLKLSFRQGGEKFYRPDLAHGKSLKNYFQEQQIPRWKRDSALLVSYQDKVIFIQEKIL